jgi:Zn-dependent protease with chaperone function
VSSFGAVLFQVFVSAMFSFAGAAGIVLLARPLLRLEHGRLRLALAALPLAKLVQETARWIPADAFYWVRASGLHRDLGSFRLGVGLARPFIPVVHFVIGAIAQGRLYSDSAADLLAMMLERKVAPRAPAAIGLSLALVGLALLIRLAARTWVDAPRRATVMAGARVLSRESLGLRSVDVVVSPAWRGVPFAAGLLQPYVCFSETVWSALPEDERRAVVLHELAHHRFFDVLAVGAASTVRALFWFVPFASAFARDVRAECELAADASAISRGADPKALASALVRVAELARAERGPLLAFGRPEPLLARRVQLLVADGPAPSRGRRIFWLLATVLVAATVFRATTFGHP